MRRVRTVKKVENNNKLTIIKSIRWIDIIEKGIQLQSDYYDKFGAVAETEQKNYIQPTTLFLWPFYFSDKSGQFNRYYQLQCFTHNAFRFWWVKSRISLI